MYYRNNQDQLSLEEFSLPFGGRLLQDNRWVRLAGLMPWEYIEEIYAQNIGLLTKKRKKQSNQIRNKKRTPNSASSHTFYHSFQVQGRGRKEAVVFRCL